MARPAGGWLERRGLAPKLWLALAHYDRRQAAGDLVAGVTVGLVALPLAMAFAISSGLPPQAGIYTAIVAGTHHLGVRRLARPDWRPDRRVRRHRRRHRRRAHGVDGLFMCTLDGRRAARRAGPDRHGHRGAVHPASGGRRLHQRHRDPDRQHADPRSVRPADRHACRATSCRACGRWRRMSSTWSPAATALGARHAGRSSC